MALISCPECTNTLSDSAPGCPKCGFKLTSEIVAAQKQKKAKAEAEAQAFAMRWTAIIAGSIALWVAVCYLAGGNSEPASHGWDAQNLSTLRKLEAKERTTGMVKSAYDDLSLRWDGTRRSVTVGELSRHLDEKYIHRPSPFEGR